MYCDPNTTAQILQEWLHRCGPYELPASWRHIPVAPDVHQIASDPQEILRTLEAHFGAQALEACGILVRDEANNIVLAPQLRTPGTPLVGLRDVERGELFDLLTPQGTLLAAGPSLYTSLQDRDTCLALQKWNPVDPQLLVTWEMGDLIVLRSLGAPAALADGLDRLDERHLQQLIDSFEGFERPPSVRDRQPLTFPFAPPPTKPDDDGLADDELADDELSADDLADDDLADDDESSGHGDAAQVEAPIHQDGYSGPTPNDGQPDTQRDTTDKEVASLPGLTFVGWHPHLLSTQVPDGLRPLAEMLLNFEKYDVVSLGAVAVWRPGEECLAQLQFAADHSQVACTREALLQSSDDETFDLYRLVSNGRPAQTTANSFAEARRRLQAALRSSGNGGADQQARLQACEGYLHQVNAELIQPLWDAAFARTETIERSLHGMLASLAAAYFAKAPLVEAELESSLRLLGPPAGDAHQLKELLAMIKPMLTLARELKQ